MKPIPGARPPSVRELVRVGDRISFLYLEHATISRDANALTATTAAGTYHVPAAALGCLLLGPGTRVTQQAMVLVGESGVTTVWVGEQGVRYYAHGRGVSSTTRLLQEQARRVSNERLRLGVARAMYAMRFPGEDVAGLTMQQLRGREGTRVRRAYRAQAEEHGLDWERRTYDPEDFAGGDRINQALSAAHSALYGVVHTVIVGMGCSPGLGFVHTGHDRSFVYDMADLYKTAVSVPVAFEVAASDSQDVPGMARRRVRDRVVHLRLLENCARDLKRLLLEESEQDVDWESLGSVVNLWDGRAGTVPSGINYDEDDWGF